MPQQVMPGIGKLQMQAVSVKAEQIPFPPRPRHLNRKMPEIAHHSAVVIALYNPYLALRDNGTQNAFDKLPLCRHRARGMHSIAKKHRFKWLKEIENSLQSVENSTVGRRPKLASPALRKTITKVRIGDHQRAAFMQKQSSAAMSNPAGSNLDT